MVTPLFGWLMVLGALAMLGLAGWMYRSGSNERLREKVNFHFNQVLPTGITLTGAPPGRRETFWAGLRVRGSIYAGFELKTWHFFALPLLLALFALAGWMWLKWLGAMLLAGLAFLVIGILLPYVRWRRRQDLITAQVPMFIDQMLRSLSSGRSVEGAVRLAALEAPEPLLAVLERVVRATDLGADMAQTLSDAARLHGLRELSLIALALRISNSYGSSPKEMLQSVVQMIRQQELARRELAAMTGETKISAWVLALTPVAMGAYMIFMNPGYLEMMLAEGGGRTTLQVALVLQGTGVFILWRMLKSV